jgi:enoyl-CoA hydratase/carnithine racemase
MAVPEQSVQTSDEVSVSLAEGILWITFNRPKNLNALTTPMLEFAAHAVESHAKLPSARAIVVTGAGKAFSAGADLASGNDKSSPPGRDTIEAANRLTTALCSAPQPVLTAVNGPAVGVGCSFALAGDLVVAHESSYFLLAFARVGLMPDGGATALVAAAIGRVRAARMALLAEPLTAPDALDWGLVSTILTGKCFDSGVEDMARKLASGPAAAYARTKQAINAATIGNLSEALNAEKHGQTELFQTEDHAEGLRAFQEGRLPTFGSNDTAHHPAG